MAIERFWMWAVLALATIAGLDVALARIRYAKRMRMTLQETRDERSEQEGKPEIRARRRAVGAKLARRLRVAAIKSAAAVITNPTHVAVALRYAPPAVDVPTVVSTGEGWAAAVVRSVAALHGVPVIESPDLARALHRRVEIDEPIPDEFYAAVAAIFAWILRTRGRLGGTETP
jgi:flagellar biosynthetic protein FlhB